MLYYIISYCICYIISYYVMLSYLVSCYVMLYYVISYHIILHYFMLYHVIWYDIILYYTTLYYIILYYISNCIISYYIVNMYNSDIPDVNLYNNLQRRLCSISRNMLLFQRCKHYIPQHLWPSQWCRMVCWYLFAVASILFLSARRTEKNYIQCRLCCKVDSRPAFCGWMWWLLLRSLRFSGCGSGYWSKLEPRI